MTAIPAATVPVATVPAAHGQERLLFLDRLTGGHPFFHTPVVLDVRGELDLARIRTAVTGLVRRHEVLRTTLHLTGEGTVQVVHATPLMGWQETRLEVPDPTAPLHPPCVAEIVDRARDPIRFDVMPVYSCQLFLLSPRRTVVLLRLHHIALDAWSIDVLLRDLEALYNDAPLGPAEPFRLFAAEQRLAEGSPPWQASAEYWRTQIEGVDPVLEVPGDFSRPPVARHSGATESAPLPGALISAAEQETTRLHVSPMSFYLAAWAKLLGELTGRRTMLIGTGFANREPRFRSTVGFFANQMPLRVTVPLGGFRVPGAADEFARDVSRTVLVGYEHAAYPFEALVRDVGLPRDLTRSPLIQVGFNFAARREPMPPLVLGAARAEHMFVDCRTSRVDLVLGVLRVRRAATSVLWYDTALYTARTARELLSQYAAALGELIGRPGQQGR